MPSLSPLELTLSPHDLFSRQWLLLTAGDFPSGEFNTMTIGWGSMGTMWGRPYVSVVVRPTRYTYQFMERFETFTLTTFPETFRSALTLLGKTSGRDEDKIAHAGLHPIASKLVSAPTFQEAHLTLECKKIYFADFDPSRFLDPTIEQKYPLKDYHRVYYGELLYVQDRRPSQREEHHS